MNEQTVEIRTNADGSLDEVVGGTGIHLEQMGPNHWWMAVYCDGARVTVSFHARGKITAYVEREHGPSPALAGPTEGKAPTRFGEFDNLLRERGVAAEAAEGRRWLGGTLYPVQSDAERETPYEASRRVVRERAEKAGGCRFSDQDGNFGDTVSRCNHCGNHQGSPAAEACPYRRAR